MRPKSASDIRKLPGYVDDVDPDLRPLKSIIDGYRFKEQWQCGLKSCRRWHNEGYVVELLDGGITNVGHICGGKFGIRFTQERDRYREQVLRPQLLSRLSSTRLTAINRVSEVDDLAARMQRLVAMRSALFRRYPSLQSELLTRAETNRTALTTVRQRTEKEIEVLMAVTSGMSRERALYEEVRVGEIQGLAFFRVTNANVAAVASRLHHLAQIDLPQLPTDALVDWDVWLGGFDEMVAACRNKVQAGERFMSEANVRQLSEFVSVAAGARRPGRIVLRDLEALDRTPRPKNRSERRQQRSSLS